MMIINAENMLYSALNEQIRSTTDDVTIQNCLGQRFIAAGLSGRTIRIEGTPGNALGAYLNGADIIVNGNAQDATGDTMNDGRIVIHGNIGDAAGYAMRGGCIFVEGNAGYRAGIHMKAYQEKQPKLIIGGAAGSFLGEYQAGGLIVVLGLNHPDRIVSYFPCTGMHGGKMILRSKCENIVFPKNVTAHPITDEEKEELRPVLTDYCAQFGYSCDEVLDADFTVIVPDSKNPYRQMYVAN